MTKRFEAFKAEFVELCLKYDLCVLTDEGYPPHVHDLRGREGFPFLELFDVTEVGDDQTI